MDMILYEPWVVHTLLYFTVCIYITVSVARGWCCCVSFNCDVMKGNVSADDSVEGNKRPVPAHIILRQTQNLIFALLGRLTHIFNDIICTRLLFWRMRQKREYLDIIYAYWDIQTSQQKRIYRWQKTESRWPKQFLNHLKRPRFRLPANCSSSIF